MNQKNKKGSWGIVLVAVIFSAILPMASAADGKTSIFLRVANLLPLKSEKVVVKQVESSQFSTEVVAGSLLPYSEIEKPGAFKISVGSRVIKTFPLDATESGKYYTIAIYQQAPGNFAASLLLDSSTAPNTDKEASRRFRGYFGGLDFAYWVNAGDLGQWIVSANQALLVDIPIADKTPTSITITYLVAGVKTDLNYNLPFSETGCCSAFVFQRSPTRPRIFAVPDGVALPK